MISLEPKDVSEPLLGLWGATRQLGPEIKGLLRLGLEGESWWAEINGYRVPGRVKDSSFEFALPGDRGTFRGNWHQGQQDLGGQCGICGDPYDATVKDNEAGGKYAKGIIPTSG